MAETTAAGLLAVVGIFDIAGTIGSGWLTDRIDPRILLVGYYTFRGVGLAVLPFLLADTVHPSMIVFVVVYGLDWVATVPPTVALCRRIFGADGTVVFGWVFASHRIGAAVAALAAGAVRDAVGTYTPAWLGGAGLCLVAAVLSIVVSKRRPGSGLPDDGRPRPPGPTATAATPVRDPAAPSPTATVAGAASDLTPDRSGRCTTRRNTPPRQRNGDGLYPVARGDEHRPFATGADTPCPRRGGGGLYRVTGEGVTGEGVP